MANLGEALSGLAVVISLVYVGVELRLNTRSNKAQTSYEGAHSWAEVTMALMNDPELAALAGRSMNEDSAAFDERHNSALFFLGRSTMERLDGLYYRYRNRQLEPEFWNIRVTWARRCIATPYWRAWWLQERNSWNYSPSFVKELERLPSDGGHV
ncbi:MAG: hypothetical protein P8008_02875 [Gammaproteobacteria bacterium]